MVNVENIGSSIGTFTSGLGGTILNTVAIVGAILLGGGLLFGIAWLFKSKINYDIVVRIYSKRKQGWKTWDDKGAFLKNKKTGDVYGFKLKGEKEILQIPNYDALMMTVKGGNVLHLEQLSNTEYFVLMPMIDDPTDEAIQKKEGVIKLKIIESDIQLWATTMIDRLYAMYKKPSLWDKILPILLYAVPMMISLILMYLLLQKFDVLKDVASNLAQAATALKDLHQTGALIPAGG